MKKILLIDWCRENGNEKILKEWDYGKNSDVDIKEVSSKSAQSVWWKCSICGYEWKAQIGNRTYCKSGCPVCANKTVWKGHNDLATTNPELAKEWDYEKNIEIAPDSVVAGSYKKVWWKCLTCGYEWEAEIGSR